MNNLKHIRVTERHAQILDVLKRMEYRTHSEVVRSALDEYFKKYYKKELQDEGIRV